MGHCVQIRKYEKLETEEERLTCSREIFDSYIMKELLACSHVSAPPGPGWALLGCRAPALMTTPPTPRPCPPQPFSKSAIEHVQGHLVKKQVPPDLFQVGAGCRVRLGGWPGCPISDSGFILQPYIEEICQNLRGDVFQKFIER